jgi:hypothetical protein
MDPAEGANAVAHLDHTAGTKARLWRMLAATAEWLCVVRASYIYMYID